MNATDTHQAVSLFLKAVTDLDQYWSDIYNEIGKADSETQDLLHEAELSKMNASEGFTLAAKLQEVRQRRRRNKNEQEALKPLKEWSDKHKQTAIDLYKVLTAMQRVLETQQARQYHPRIRTDLKICKGVNP
jgi:hypothetical protein